jgi:hypothetical protein
MICDLRIILVVKSDMITRWMCIAEPASSSNFWAARAMCAANYNAPPMMTGLLAVYRLKHTAAFSSSNVISTPVQQLL